MKPVRLAVLPSPHPERSLLHDPAQPARSLGCGAVELLRISKVPGHQCLDGGRLEASVVSAVARPGLVNPAEAPAACCDLGRLERELLTGARLRLPLPRPVNAPHCQRGKNCERTGYARGPVFEARPARPVGSSRGSGWHAPPSRMR